MARRNRTSAPDAPGPTVGLFPIDSGTAELVRDRDNPRGYMLFVNGVESSHADLSDPAWLEFEYLRWMAAIIEAHQPADRPFETVHLGAAGCSLARHLLAVRPTSRHLGVEIDGKLAEFVREWFNLPRAPALRIRIGEARAVTEALHTASRDVIVRDVFSGAITPTPLTTLEFTQHVHRVLRPGGLYLLNCADIPNLQLAKAEAATVASVFGQVVITADPPMLKGRRRGNVIIAASDSPIGGPALARDLLGGAVPAGLWDNDRVRAFAGQTPPLRDGVVTTSEPATALSLLDRLDQSS